MAAQTGKNFHRFSVKEAAVWLLLTDSGSSGPTYGSSGVYIPGAQTLTFSGTATQEQLEGDDLVLAVESSDESIDVSIEHGYESFDMMEVVKGWYAAASGNDFELWDIPADSTVYCKLVVRCHKTGVSGGDLVVTFPKVNFGAFERSVENKAFGKNTLNGKAIYTTSTTSIGGTDRVYRMRMQQRETAAALSLNTDTTPPTCTVSPTDAATGVAVSANIVFTFSEDLDPGSVVPANFVLMTAAGVEVALTSANIALVNNGASTTVTINPTSNLSASTDYVITATTGIRDKAGNSMAAAKIINFQTA